MASRDLTKQLYSETLLRLCESQSLSSINVTTVITAAKTARQTFYNHFSDINDLVGYIPISFMKTYGPPAYFAETVLEAYGYAIEHKGFFCQLPSHEGQNNFRDTFVSFMRKLMRREFLSGALDEAERQYRLVAIEQAIIGVTDTFLEWCRHEMEWPVDVLVRVQFDAMPPFIKAAQSLSPRLRRIFQ